MCLQPEEASCDNRINAGLPPPRSFISAAMHLTVMSSAEWDSKLIADFATKRRGLRKSQVMGIGRTPAAEQTSHLGYRFDVLSIANAALRR